MCAYENAGIDGSLSPFLTLRQWERWGMGSIPVARLLTEISHKDIRIDLSLMIG